MMTDPHICLFEWSDDHERIGSNHACGEERGHAGDHDCLTCHTQHPAIATAQVSNATEKIIVQK